MCLSRNISPDRRKNIKTKSSNKRLKQNDRYERRNEP